MYKDVSIESFLNDLADKEVEMGGGSLIGLNLASVCALIEYIANLTLGKKKYMSVQDEVKVILEEARRLKEDSLEIIDKDKEILEEILLTYKLKEEAKDEYDKTLIKAVDFSFDVLNKSIEVLKLALKISKIGNLMLVSDFEICANTSYNAAENSVTNIKINLLNLEDENYIEKCKNRYLKILDEAYEIREDILKISGSMLK